MKKTISLFLTVALLFCMAGVMGVQAETPDVLMLYDGEGDTGNGWQDPWGQLAGRDGDYYTEGTTSYAVQSFYNGLYFFQNTYDYLGECYDISGYDYIEFDIMSWYDMVCDLELSVVSNLTAHHGSDYEMFEVYLPAQQFVHVKMPIKDFVTLSTTNRDKYDTQENIKGDDELHFAGYSLNWVARLRWQFTYCKTLDGYDCDDIYMVFDNVCATKNGATHTHNGSQTDVKDIQYYADVDFDQMAADVVIGMIDALTGEDAAAIAEARSAYNKLTDAQKALVTNLAKLEELEYVEPQPTEYDYGNVDGQGEPNAADALLVLKSVVGKETLTAEQVILADVDGNGDINATDALIILQYTVGKIKEFPVATKLQ